jgi:hypothetical protein
MGLPNNYIPAANTVIPASIIDIAKAIKSQLVAVAGFQPTAVFITSKRAKEIPHIVGEKDCILRCGREIPDAAAIRGTGGLNDQRTRTLTLTIRTRMALDKAGSDSKHLLNEDTGHIATEDAVFNALEILLWPTDIAGNAITNNPIRLGELSEAETDPQAPEWLSSYVGIECDYSRKLTPQMR